VDARVLKLVLGHVLDGHGGPSRAGLPRRNDVLDRGHLQGHDVPLTRGDDVKGNVREPGVKTRFPYSIKTKGS